MEDVAALQRTVRRCTALLLLALAVVIGLLDDGAFWVAVVLAVGSGLYLLGSVIFVAEHDTASTPGTADGDGPAT